MADWKQRGFVPDSDEEGEEILVAPVHGRLRGKVVTFDPETASIPQQTISVGASQGSNRHDSGHFIVQDTYDEDFWALPRTPDENAVTTSLPAVNTAQALQSSLEDGLSMVREILSTSPKSFSKSMLEDFDDSPLSSPPISLRLSPRRGDDSSLIRQSPVEQFFPSSTAVRSLRTRTAIQQNPYSLEDAQYRLALTARGIKPVRVREVSPILGMDHREDDTQDAEFQQSSSQMHNSPPMDFMELDEPLESRTNRRISTPQGISDRDGTTGTRTRLHVDAEALLHPDGHTQAIQLPSVTTLPSGFQVYDFSDSDSEQAPLSLKPKSYSHNQDSIPTPPRSLNTETASLQYLSQQSSRAHSPTAHPVTPFSSVSRLRKRPVVDEDSSFESETERSNPRMTTLAAAAAAAAADDDDDDDESNSSVGEESQDLQIMQRRVKGVLPASWWRIDRIQKDIKKRDDASGKNNRAVPEKGVAQRSVFRSGLTGIPLDLSLSDASEENEQINLDLTPMKPRSNTFNREESEAMEVVRDNGLDYMLPTQKRLTNSISRQTKHREGFDKFVNENGRSGVNLGVSPIGHRTKNGGQSRSHKRRRVRHKTEGIRLLDAPDFSPSKNSSRPKFLRVAARQALQSGKIEGVPRARKFFRFTSTQDNADVQAELQHWEQKLSNTISSDRRGEVFYAESTAISPTSASTRHSNQALPSSTMRKHSTGYARANSIHGHSRRDREYMPGTRTTRKAEMRTVLQDARTRKLLPRINRSGPGHLVTHGPDIYTGQLEVPRTINILNRNHHLKVPTTARLSRLYQSEVSDEAVELRGSPSHIHDAPMTARIRQRKQNPKHRTRNSRETRSTPTKIYITQDTANKAHDASNIDFLNQYQLELTEQGQMRILQQWYSYYQTAWFHGRDKDGKFCISDQSTVAFQQFLSCLKQFLLQSLQSMTEDSDGRQLRSFVHRLVPNRGQIGKANEIGDKTARLRIEDAIVARNVFDLHICFLSNVPVLSPRIRVLGYKVNFSTAHDFICRITLNAWSQVVDLPRSGTIDHDDLADWIYSMLEQLMLRWDHAETEARREAADAASRVSENVILRTVEHNRKNTSMLLQEVLSKLSDRAEQVLMGGEYSALFSPSRCLQLVDIVLRISSKVSGITSQVLNILHTVMSTESFFSDDVVQLNDLLNATRRVLTILFGDCTTQHLRLLRNTVTVYFNIAHGLVKKHSKSWDSFLSSSSSYALEMLLSSTILGEAKSIFYHLLLNADVEQYRMEYRAQILTHWIRAMLQPLRPDSAVFDLTDSILKLEHESLNIRELTRVLSTQVEMLGVVEQRESLYSRRSDVVNHIIRVLHGQEADPEGLWLAGGFDEADAVNMLRTIFTTLKETWLTLEDHSEGKTVYTSLIYAILEEYKLFSRRDFTVDPWFYNSATFPQPQNSSLLMVLRLRPWRDNTPKPDLKQLLKQEIVNAVRSDSLDTFVTDLKTTLLPTSCDRIVTEDELTYCLTRHAELVQHIAVHIRHTYDQLTVANALAEVLLYILSNLECRIDQLSPITTIPLIRSCCTAILPAIKSTLSTNQTHNQMISVIDTERKWMYSLTTLIYIWSTRLLQDDKHSNLRAGLFDDVEWLCDLAAEEVERNGPARQEAINLLQTVMAGADAGLLHTTNIHEIGFG